MKEIAENVWSLESAPDPHAFLLCTEGKWILLDAGYPWQKGRLLREVQSRTQQLDAIVLTHHDLDHVGGAALLQKHFGAPVYLHEADHPFFCGARKKPAGKDRMHRRTRWLIRTPADVRPLDPAALGGLEAIWLPGHTPGHTAFRFRDMVFCGDMFFNRAGKGFENLWNYHGDFAATADSLDRLAEMQDVLLVPAHGEAVRLTKETAGELHRLSEALRGACE